MSIEKWQAAKINYALETKYPPAWIEGLPLLKIDDGVQLVNLLWNGKKREIIDTYIDTNGLELEHKREIMFVLDKVSYPMIDGEFPLGPLHKNMLAGTVKHIPDEALERMGLNPVGITIIRKLFGENTN